MFAMWENDMLKVAKWFTYFEDFQQFSSEFQVKFKNFAMFCVQITIKIFFYL